MIKKLNTFLTSYEELAEQASHGATFFAHARTGDVEGMRKFLTARPLFDINAQDDAGKSLKEYAEKEVKQKRKLKQIRKWQNKQRQRKLTLDKSLRSKSKAPRTSAQTQAQLSAADGSEAKTMSAEFDALADPSFGYASYNTALHYAADFRHLEMIRFLNSAGADMDATNKLGSTPLHIAAAHGFSDTSQLLVQLKANVNAKNAIGNTPLHCAVYNCFIEVAQFLLAESKDPVAALRDVNRIGVSVEEYAADDYETNEFVQAVFAEHMQGYKRKGFHETEEEEVGGNDNAKVGVGENENQPKKELRLRKTADFSSLYK